MITKRPPILRVTIIIVGIILAGIAYNQYRNIQVDPTPYLPPESVFIKDIKSDMESTIANALLNVMGKNDFELAVHVNLVHDEVTEEVTTYEPNEMNTTQTTKHQTPGPNLNTLPGIMNNPFRAESLPGFPSYFDSKNIQKDDYMTRGLFSDIVTTAYELPESTLDASVPTDLIPMDTQTSEFDNAIATVVQNDILKLYQSGDFGPNDFLSKASLITAIVRINYPTSNYDAPDVVSELPYTDIPQTHWAYSYIKIALENQLIEPDVVFNPNQKVTVADTIRLIEKTPLLSSTFSSLALFEPVPEVVFQTDSQEEITESSVYYNHEKKIHKTPSTKIKNVAIRLIINDSVLYEDLTLATIETIVRNVVELDENRNDTLTISSHPFTKLPLSIQFVTWPHWQQLFVTVFVTAMLLITGYIIRLFYKMYQKYVLNKQRIQALQKDKEEKLAKIYKDEEERSFERLKEAIIEEADQNTDVFTLKLAKWLELLQSNEMYSDNKSAFEKICIVILFVDFERPGLSTRIIKLLPSHMVKDTLQTIEAIPKIGFEKTRMNLIEFGETCMSPYNLFGGKTVSNHIIDRTFSEKEKRFIFNRESEHPFAFINHVQRSKLIDFLTSENPAVAAFILNRCEEDIILSVVESIPEASMLAIAKHLVHTKNTVGPLMDMYESMLRDTLFMGESYDQTLNKIHIQKASSVFETLPKSTRNAIFADLQKTDAEMAMLIQNELFTFDDIVLLPDLDVQRLIFEIKDMTIVATALRDASSDLIARFTENFSDRFNERYETAQSELNNPDSAAIVKAQFAIVRCLRELERKQHISELKSWKKVAS
jgi:flagellar motor switch protein FliG